MSNNGQFVILKDRFNINGPGLGFEYISKDNIIVANFVQSMYPDAEVKRLIGVVNKETKLKPIESASSINGVKTHMVLFKLDNEPEKREKEVMFFLALAGVKPDELEYKNRLALMTLIHPMLTLNETK